MPMDPAERLRRNAERRRVKRHLNGRRGAVTHCWECSMPFTPARDDARYCSNACRQKHHRRHCQWAARERHDAILTPAGIDPSSTPNQWFLDMVERYAGLPTPEAIVTAINEEQAPNWTTLEDVRRALVWLGARQAKHASRR
jgi:hypothetical protein